MYKLAVFDMDGTILDTIRDLTSGVNHALKAKGYPERTVEEMRIIVGNGIRRSIELAAPEGLSENELNELHEIFKPYYAEHSADTTCAYPGIKELLERLRAAGIKTAVVSNKADTAVKDLAEKYFPGLFDEAIGEHAGVNRKPAPDEVMLVLDSLGIEAKDAVYIGDSEVDILTAKNSGLDGIFVEWGFRTRESLEKSGATRICKTTDEVFEIISGAPCPARVQENIDLKRGYRL